MSARSVRARKPKSGMGAPAGNVTLMAFFSSAVEPVPSMGVPGSRKRNWSSPSKPAQVMASRIGDSGTPTFEPCTTATADPLVEPFPRSHRASNGISTARTTSPTAPSAVCPLIPTTSASTSPGIRYLAIVKAPLLIAPPLFAFGCPERASPQPRRSRSGNLHPMLVRSDSSGSVLSHRGQ